MLFALKVVKEKTDNYLEELLNGISQGDNNAFEQFYLNTKADVYGFALSILKDTFTAEDVLQDTYVKIMHAASSYSPCGKPMAWVFTITKNLALMKLREKKRYGEMPDYEEASQESHLEKIENSTVLSLAMEILSSQECSIIVMHAVSGMKHREISEILDIPLSTVLSKYNRALKKLKNELKEAF
ncbi:MAG: RNA polymerase sigma factor [Acutalibacteraceae bacterium]